MKEMIWKHLTDLNISDFFITADIVKEGVEFPKELDSFIGQKLQAIHMRGITGRKFVFKEGDWKIYLTFFPTDEVVKEQYALKNKMIKSKCNLSEL